MLVAARRALAATSSRKVRRGSAVSDPKIPPPPQPDVAKSQVADYGPPCSHPAPRQDHGSRGRWRARGDFPGPGRPRQGPGVLIRESPRQHLPHPAGHVPLPVGRPLAAILIHRERPRRAMRCLWPRHRFFGHASGLWPPPFLWPRQRSLATPPFLWPRHRFFGHATVALPAARVVPASETTIRFSRRPIADPAAGAAASGT